jgi:hypothetical protein
MVSQGSCRNCCSVSIQTNFIGPPLSALPDMSSSWSFANSLIESLHTMHECHGSRCILLLFWLQDLNGRREAMPVKKEVAYILKASGAASPEQRSIIAMYP